jgi:hypothetical protein
MDSLRRPIANTYRYLDTHKHLQVPIRTTDLRPSPRWLGKKLNLSGPHVSLRLGMNMNFRRSAPQTSHTCRGRATRFAPSILKTSDDPGTQGCISANLGTFSRSVCEDDAPILTNELYSLAITNRELVFCAVSFLIQKEL